MPVCAPEKSPPDPELFEVLCRAATTRMEVPSFCRLRRCRRGAFCEGKLELRTVVPPWFRGLKDVDVLLPFCMARADDAWFGQFVQQWIPCHEDYFCLVRPPRAARSLLSLDEHWPVIDPVDDEVCTPEEGDATRSHAEAGLAQARELIAAISSSLAARDRGVIP
ncbi:hypothetical protein P6U16_18940 [Rhizobium sp. 32-5/1]|uniref:hypothetical protein n=1 Tax=Rhizobium sp. 32-5/1 TaxID=3019602 RepID=UPI00240DF305|nr:hypothetical protein [Rhizobium sp. 32-5/1]WEZ82987.1 hypothetical protein P6U16_18940 [Rhizobium sp. 32-5/1]